MAGITKHIPVMLEEVLEVLDIKPEGIYLDLTLGRVGHASAIFKKLSPNGLLIGFDKDQEAICWSQKELRKIGPNFKLIQKDFRFLDQELQKLKIKFVDGVIVDLGVSSPQLDEAYRGFSYNKEAKLDMRMDTSQTLDAAWIVNNSSKKELATIFKNYADVKFALQVANALIKNRPVVNTLELAKVVRQSLPAFIIRQKNIVRQIFQALRIAVNDEINALQEMLDQAIKYLKKDAKLLVITFHSIEDKIVKDKFGILSRNWNNKLPIVQIPKYLFKTLKPSVNEIETNWRSRSARLRILVKK